MSQVWISSLSGCFIIMGEDVSFLLCCALVVWAQSGFLSRIDNIVFAAALCIYFPLSTPWYLFPFFHKIVSEWCRKHFCLCGLYLTDFFPLSQQLGILLRCLKTGHIFQSFFLPKSNKWKILHHRWIRNINKTAKSEKVWGPYLMLYCCTFIYLSHQW